MWDGVGVLVGVSRDQTVLDVAAADAVGAQQHQRLPPVRRQLHNLNKFGIVIKLMIARVKNYANVPKRMHKF